MERFPANTYLVADLVIASQRCAFEAARSGACLLLSFEGPRFAGASLLRAMPPFSEAEFLRRGRDRVRGRPEDLGRALVGRLVMVVLAQEVAPVALSAFTARRRVPRRRPRSARRAACPPPQSTTARAVP